MSNAGAYKVIIVDDCDEFAQGLRHLLSTMPEFEVINSFSDGRDIIESDKLGLADIVLLDVNMPIVNGIEVGKRINYLFPDIKLVAVTFNNDQVCLEELVGAGFKGYVLKQSIVEELEKVLTVVLNKQYAFPKELMLRAKI
ncbi:response regulator [Carboxylicivirga taeanensis]|uniref:response regulator n=1 Tax=Carboxylicivirga taeanensis TaxID=1416875 RepID=UPI003F6DBE09